jgi:hypothetical protein
MQRLLPLLPLFFNLADKIGKKIRENQVFTGYLSPPGSDLKNVRSKATWLNFSKRRVQAPFPKYSPIFALQKYSRKFLWQPTEHLP